MTMYGHILYAILSGPHHFNIYEQRKLSSRILFSYFFHFSHTLRYYIEKIIRRQLSKEIRVDDYNSIRCNYIPAYHDDFKFHS